MNPSSSEAASSDDELFQKILGNSSGSKRPEQGSPVEHPLANQPTGAMPSLYRGSVVEPQSTDTSELHCADTWGDYTIIKKLGSGGMGEVYHVTHTMLGKDYALKVMRQHLVRSEDYKRFLKEMQLTLSLSEKPGLVWVHAAGKYEGFAYYVMDYIEGTTLQGKLDSEGPMTESVASRIAAELAAIVTLVHKEMIAHRDIKPTNIMMAKSGTVLVDFGLATKLPFSACDSAQIISLSENSLCGTMGYIAPEQFYTPGFNLVQNELFSLGVVLFQMLTNRLPHVSLVLQRRFLFLTSRRPQFGEPSLAMTFRGSTVAFAPPLRPLQDFVVVPLAHLQ